MARKLGEAKSLVDAELTLSEARSGDAVTVSGILGDEAFRGRIMAMGILPGVALTVVSGGRRQPLLVALPGSRCVVDQRSAGSITVRAARRAATREGAPR
jgi:Fe2+ transport system protein FeoA